MQESIVEQVKRLWKQWQPAIGLNVYVSSLAQTMRGRLLAVNRPTHRTDSARDVERRPLTVLFCDLVGSTPLSRRLDPEDLREILSSYHSVVRDEISAQGGYTAQLLGDGVMAYFGWPEAHEDDPVRAVRAGLAILRACSELSRRVRSQLEGDLEVRVGIHSGTVVLAEMGKRGRGEFLAVGEVPNVASKTQSAAHPQSLVVTETTRRLTEGQFRFSQLSPRAAPIPFELYVVTSETPARSRLDWSGSLTTFVNRHSELHELQAAWQIASTGKSVAVIVSGEPGSGKSRLAREFCARLTSAEVLECTCLARLQNSPFYPLVDLLERQIGIDRHEPQERRLERVTAWLSRSALASAETIEVVHSLLGLHEQGAVAATSAVKQRRTTLDTLFTLLFRARSETSVLVLDDAQWADPSTIELIDLVLKAKVPAGMLVLLTARRDAEKLLAGLPGVTQVAVKALNAEQSRTMVGALMHGKPLQRELLRFLIERSDGVPLYIEELTRHLLETNMLALTNAGYQLTGSLSDMSVPTSMQAFLTERLDRLGHSRQLVQIASVIGLTFESTVLAHVMQRPLSEVERSLNALSRASVVLRVASHEYVFRHALLREAAYQMLSRERRSEHHRTIAEVLSRRDVPATRVQAEVLAYHFTGAGDARRAALQWLVAGREATSRHAVLEAMDAYRKGLACCAKLPASSDTDSLQVDLLTGYGFTCIATQGFSAHEVEQIFTQARDLCAGASDAPPMRILFGIWAVYIVRGDPDAIASLAEWLRRTADSSEHSADERLIAHACLGTLAFYLGDTSATQHHCERGIELCEIALARQQNQRLITTYGYDGLLFSHLFAAWNAVHCDEHGRGKALLDEALALAERINSPFCSAMAAAFAATIARDLRNPALAQLHGQRAISLAVEYGFPFWLAAGQFAAGWAESELGDQDKAATLIEQGLAVYSQIGARISKPYYISYLVEVYMRQGRLEDADRCADEALEIAAATVGRHYEAELLRLKAEIAYRQQRLADAQRCCADALKKASELRLAYVERCVRLTMSELAAAGFPAADS